MATPSRIQAIEAGDPGGRTANVEPGNVLVLFFHLALGALP
jgi:hypothetical protein